MAYPGKKVIHRMTSKRTWYAAGHSKVTTSETVLIELECGHHFTKDAELAKAKFMQEGELCPCRTCYLEAVHKIITHHAVDLNKLYENVAYDQGEHVPGGSAGFVEFMEALRELQKSIANTKDENTKISAWDSDMEGWSTI